ncbi:maleylpyruvate isomerase N-terminal domain-containing protein [Cellulomonas massiliensis]|uniref:maleylpyruvate isomerase N-terminal domain-containing protein n=1 Tax=Cellulomonas massiliensis TaxID=1465811 RepID=UPI000315C3B9|nr:maleylpyruvate isomerase N-terminal domain-containing protein [Cellulomonas massiliensis]
MGAAELRAASQALRAQWDRLRPWLRDVVDDDAAAHPSVLDGWSVADLVAHVGRAMDALTACSPLPAGTVPLSLGEYLGTYAGRAAEIAETTRTLAAQVAGDPLRWADEQAAAAFARLDALGPSDLVVQARRGPVLLSTMTTSRVVELVVHADDLWRSVRRIPGAGPGEDPVDREALAFVAGALLTLVHERGGWDLEVDDARAWVRLATGRESYDVDLLARALRPRYTSDAVPDLGRVLPLL